MLTQAQIQVQYNEFFFCIPCDGAPTFVCICITVVNTCTSMSWHLHLHLPMRWSKCDPGLRELPIEMSVKSLNYGLSLLFTKAPSTSIHQCFNPQSSLCGFPFRPQVSGESGRWISNCLNPHFESTNNLESCGQSQRKRCTLKNIRIRVDVRAMERCVTSQKTAAKDISEDGAWKWFDISRVRQLFVLDCGLVSVIIVFQ